jgi:hypothetical protein
MNTHYDRKAGAAKPTSMDHVMSAVGLKCASVNLTEIRSV